MIVDLKDGMRVEEQFLVGSASKSVSNTGAFYLTLELRDASGTISGKKWEVVGNDEEVFVAGNVVLISGEVVKYRDNLQLKVLKGSLVPAELIDFNSLLTPPPVPREELEKRFKNYVESIKDKDCRALLDYFINKFSSKLFSSI